MNSGVLLGFQTPTAHLDSHTASNLLWVLFSCVRGKGYVGHVLVSGKGTVKMTVWHSKVPSIWISECQGNLHSVVREAMRRRLGGGGCVLMPPGCAMAMGGASPGFGTPAVAFYGADRKVVSVTGVGYF